MMLRALLLAGCFMLDSTRAAEEASLPRKPAAEVGQMSARDRLGH
jgi:hypothetical protein